jgi:hypothetical protein
VVGNPIADITGYNAVAPEQRGKTMKRFPLLVIDRFATSESAATRAAD